MGFNSGFKGLRNVGRLGWIFYYLCETFITSSRVIARSQFSSPSSIGATVRCGLWPVEQCPSILSCHQLSPSSHSQHLKISFYFFSPSFPGSSASSRPFQFLSEDLFGHPLHYYHRGSLRSCSTLPVLYRIFFLPPRL